MAKRAAQPAEPAAAAQPDPETSGPAHPLTLLDDLIGQEPAKRTLLGAMQSGRVHHAWIFSGPVGVGKFSAAIAFAAALLDPTTQPDLSGRLAPEAGSPVQQLVRSGAHPDLHVIRKEFAAVSSEKSVRDGKQITLAKAVIDEFLLGPSRLSRVMQGASMAGKVFIVDEAELMNANSQNALLKTLEEPAPGTVLILVSSAEDRLLTTIRSRSQRVAFAPLSDQEMSRWLVANAPDLAPARRDWLMRFAGGSPGAAKVAIEHDLFAWESEIGPKLRDTISGKFSADLGAKMAALIDDRAAAAVKAAPDSSKDAANKAWARRMLAFVAETARARLRTDAAAGGGGVNSPDVYRQLGAIDSVTQAEQHLASNVNLAMVMENLAAQLGAEPVGV